jgi:hypothetical protein
LTDSSRIKIRATIDQREGGRYFWRLNCYGNEYFGRTVGEVSISKCAAEIEACLSQIEVSRQRRTA